MTELTQWIISIIIFAAGAFFWVITYIAAPLQSKKEHKHISGVPGTAFVIFLSRRAVVALQMAGIAMSA